MREDILRRLRRVTEEEERLLAGEEVDKGLYSSGSGFIIDSEKLLAKGQLITLRPHTRLPAFLRTATIMWRSCTCAAARPSTA